MRGPILDYGYCACHKYWWNSISFMTSVVLRAIFMIIKSGQALPQLYSFLKHISSIMRKLVMPFFLQKGVKSGYELFKLYIFETSVHFFHIYIQRQGVSNMCSEWMERLSWEDIFNTFDLICRHRGTVQQCLRVPPNLWSSQQHLFFSALFLTFLWH